MEIDLRIPDDYCQGERPHYYTDDEWDWEDDEDKVSYSRRPFKIRPRGIKR